MFETCHIKPNFSLIDVMNNNSQPSTFKQILAATVNLSVEELVTLQEKTNDIIIEAMEKRENEHLSTEIKTLQKERNALMYDITEVTTEIQQLEKYLNDRKSIKYSKIERIKEIDYHIKNIDKKVNLLDLDPFDNIDQVIFHDNRINNNHNINNNSSSNSNSIDMDHNISNNNNNSNSIAINMNPFANLLIPNKAENNAFSNFDPFENI